MIKTLLPLKQPNIIRGTAISKNATLLLVLILTASSIASVLPVKGEAKTIIVPEDYPTIQAAIDNAGAGDTVFVNTGTYDVTTSIVIDKPLSLIGEDADYTIIDSQPIPYGGIAIRVKASNVTITGFTITNSGGIAEGGTAIDLQSPESYVSNCQIIGNKIVNSHDGVWVEAGDNFVIKNNLISTTAHGIYLYPRALNGIISDNTFRKNGLGQISGGDIGIYGGVNITIVDNSLSESYSGVTMNFCESVNIQGNDITGNLGYGIVFGEATSNATVTGNELAGNAVGIELATFPLGGLTNESWSGNIVYRNNLVENSQQASVDEKTSDGHFQYGTDVVAWDNGKEGNFWSDYNGTDDNSDGVGDTPYMINSTNQDRYPLMHLWNPAEPVDNVPPRISIISPENATCMKVFSLTFVTNEPVSWVGYSLDGQETVAIDRNTTITNMPKGFHSIIVYANDTFGNMGTSEKVDFTVAEEPFPVIPVATASVATIAIVGIGLLVYFKKRRRLPL